MANFSDLGGGQPASPSGAVASPSAAPASKSWLGGPLRVVGTGNGKPSRYVCSECLAPCNGVYPINRHSSQAETWVCSTCRTAARPKGEQPVHLRRSKHLEATIGTY